MQNRIENIHVKLNQSTLNIAYVVAEFESENIKVCKNGIRDESASPFCYTTTDIYHSRPKRRRDDDMGRRPLTPALVRSGESIRPKCLLLQIGFDSRCTDPYSLFGTDITATKPRSRGQPFLGSPSLLARRQGRMRPSCAKNLQRARQSPLTIALPPGVGKKGVIIGLDQVTADGDHLKVNLTKDQIRALPAYQEGD